jgi:hypothetical protein
MLTPVCEIRLASINIRLPSLALARKSHEAWAVRHLGDYDRARKDGRLNDAEEAMRAYGRSAARAAELRAGVADLLSERRRIAGIAH